MSPRILGLDYDHKNKPLVASFIRSIKKNYSPEWIKLDISPSGRGYHVRFKTPKDLTDKECLWIRRLLGDDPYRISVIYNDLNNTWSYRDVLFTAKLIDGKIYKSIPIDIDIFLKTGEEVPL